MTTHPTDTRAAVRAPMRNKVPEVTIFFWIIKILCTTVGESFADYINATLGFGLTDTTLVFSAALVIVLIAQFRLTRYVRVPYRTHVGLSRRAIFARDGGRCAYCRGSAETIDHVFPRSRGGLHAWDNVVAACAKCNHSKGDKTPAELGWRLHQPPAAPRGVAWRVLGHRTEPVRAGRTHRRVPACTAAVISGRGSSGISSARVSMTLR